PHQPDALRGALRRHLAELGAGAGTPITADGGEPGLVIEDADPNSLSGQMEGKMPVTPCAPALSVRRSDRLAHPVGGVLCAGLRAGHLADERLFGRRLRRSLRGHRRAELGREKLEKWLNSCRISRV